MKRAFIILLFISSQISLPAQYSIQVKVDSMPTKKAYLFDYLGINRNMLDSTKVSAEGNFTFTLPANAHPGMYRIIVGPQQFWDIIFNKEQIRMRTHFSSIIDSLKIIESKENQLLLSYMHFFLDIQRKGELLQRLTLLYPAMDPFQQQIMRELQKVRASDPEKITREIVEKYPSTYVAGFLRLEMSPKVPAGIEPKDELKYVLDHFWDNISFADTNQMYSPGLVNKARTFFSLYQRAYSPENLEAAMKKGLDKLMSAAAVNDVLFQFLLEDVAQWAESTEYDEFFTYLTEFYLAQASCTDEKKKGEFKEIVESYRKTAPGKQVPEIVIPRDPKGALVMSEIPSRYILVVFWASWCPHCNDMLPKLLKLYDRYARKDLEIIAISVDQKKKDWEDMIQKNGYSWINYSELKGWDCSIAYDYGIRATPTMILIDRKRTVLAKPRNPELLQQKLTELGIRAVK
ncbi:MAG: thioredoxin-like domain-containing protein [Bacteroidia bacterium]|nr:thioredoxin-like domain-containing protein [Bacteroidia bacterium]